MAIFFFFVRAIDFLAKKLLAATFIELFSSPRKFKARTIGSCSLLTCFHCHAVGSSWMYSRWSLKYCPEASFGVWKKRISLNQCIKTNYSQVSLSDCFTGKLPAGFSYKLPRKWWNISLQDTSVTGETSLSKAGCKFFIVCSICGCVFCHMSMQDKT